MEEEKKNNKGLMVGIIIFLIICLVAIFYFMFKMTYVGNKSSNEENKEETADTAETTQGEFTELTQYELQEGEEKEILIGEQKVVFSYKDSKLYWGETEVSKTGYFYVTNIMVMVVKSAGQYGHHFDFYNLEGNKINLETESNIWYGNFKIENGKLYATGYNSKYGHNADFIRLDNLNIATCGGPEGFTTSIDKYQQQIKEHENEDIQSKYEIKYEEENIRYEYVESIYKVKDFINENSNLCVEEKND